MAKEEKDPKNETDPDEDFFKKHGVESDDDKTYLRSAYLREQYIQHRKAIDEKKPPKKGLFAGRGRD
jgi:hypothetical protein